MTEQRQDSAAPVRSQGADGRRSLPPIESLDRFRRLGTSAASDVFFAEHREVRDTGDPLLLLRERVGGSERPQLVVDGLPRFFGGEARLTIPLEIVHPEIHGAAVAECCPYRAKVAVNRAHCFGLPRREVSLEATTRRADRRFFAARSLIERGLLAEGPAYFARASHQASSAMRRAVGRLGRGNDGIGTVRRESG